jgi:Fe-S oxidoreductase
MEPFVKELEYCTYCPKMCRHSCPKSNALGNETLIPQAKMELLNMLRRTALPWEPDYVMPIFGCTTCGLCERYCRHDTDVATVLQHGRAVAERRRLIHPKLRRLQERFRTRNVRLSAKLHEAYSPRLFAEEAQVAYFPGCDAIDSSIGDVRDALSVFDSLDLNFVRLMDAPYVCAGYPLWAGGCLDAARFVAADIVRSLRRFATVVVGCAACTWLLREKLPAEGFEHNTEILHISEYLYVHAERLDVRQTHEAAFYHDPCYLGRRLGVYDPPRRLISRCVRSLGEFFYNREEGECCGGGGLVPHTFPEAAAGQARRRLEEASLFDVPLVVTACPSCRRTLSAADSPVEVMDLINLIAWSIQDPDRRRLPR